MQISTQTLRQWMGPPKVILCDDRCQYEGERWAGISQLYVITLSPSPTVAQYQTGEIERRILISKQVFNAISREMGWDSNHVIRLSLDVVAHNLAASSGSTIAPITALTGRTNFSESAMDAAIARKDVREKSIDYMMWKRWSAIRLPQKAILQYDSDVSIKLSLQRNLMDSRVDLYKEGDQVERWDQRKAQWVGTFRIIADTGRRGIVENGHTIPKHHKAWTKPPISHWESMRSLSP